MKSLLRPKVKTWMCLLIGITSFIVLNPSLSNAVNYWAKTYGGTNDDHAYIAEKTADGGVIIAGSTSSFGAGSVDAWIVKLNAEGTVQWQKAYGGSGLDYTNFITQTSDGGYIAAGLTTSFGAGGEDVWILKLNADGSIAWQKTYGGGANETAYYVQETFDLQGNAEGYIAAGITRSFDAGDWDGWILKLNTDGTISWQKTYGMAGSDHIISIQQTLDSGYIATGCTTSFGAGNFDFWVLKLDPDGTIDWQKTYGGNHDESSMSLFQTNDSGYIVSSRFTRSFGAGGEDVWILKLNSDGSIGWQKTYGGISDEGATSIIQIADGRFIVAGVTNSFGAGDFDFLLMQLNSDGTVAWQKTYGGVGYDSVVSIQQNLDGGYMATGHTISFGAGNFDIWVLKLNSNAEIPNCTILGESCVVVTNTNVIGIDTNATVTNTNVLGIESDATITDSNAQVATQCEYINNPPMACAGADEAYECQSPEGAVVVLDGSCSFDSDQGDFIESWTWYEDLNANGNLEPDEIIAMGEIAYVTLPIGIHEIILVVNDGELDSEVIDDSSEFDSIKIVTVQDIEGPVTSDVIANPNPVAVNTDIALSAITDDSNACSTVASAEYSLEGVNWYPMYAQDGAFDSANEYVAATFSVPYPGVYNLCVQGTDSSGNIGLPDCTFLVVYDPEGGFVTGGGWIWSPQGAYASDPLLEGKANFGFVSKYKRGATIPTGQTEFQFKVADLNFHSDSYEWLVVAGAKAKYKGTGTINGEGEYKFMLTAIDADIHPSFEVDRFRIKIWYEVNGIENVVYDNALGNDSDLATTEIGGGSIVIHVPRN